MEQIKNDRGVGTISFILITIAVIAIGSGVFYFGKNTTNSYQSTTETTTPKSFESINPAHLPNFNYPVGWHVFAYLPSYLKGGTGANDFTVYLNEEPIQIYGDSGFPRYTIAILSLSKDENAITKPKGTVEKTETEILANGSLKVLSGYLNSETSKIAYQELVFQNDDSGNAVRVIYFGGQDAAWKVIKENLDFSKIE